MHAGTNDACLVDLGPFWQCSDIYRFRRLGKGLRVFSGVLTCIPDVSYPRADDQNKKNYRACGNLQGRFYGTMHNKLLRSLLFIAVVFDDRVGNATVLLEIFKEKDLFFADDHFIVRTMDFTAELDKTYVGRIVARFLWVL